MYTIHGLKLKEEVVKQGGLSGDGTSTGLI